MRQRVHRSLVYDDYWRYAHPTLALDFTLVVQTGKDGFACFNEGGDVDDPSVPFGYADPYLTEYLASSAQQFALIDVLKKLQAAKERLVYSETFSKASNIDYPALTVPGLGLDLLVNDQTGYPYAIRSIEDHVIYGKSTNDIVFSNYEKVSFRGSNTIKYPRRTQNIYNEIWVIEDSFAEKVIINPNFPKDMFKAKPPKSPEGGMIDPYHPHPPRTDDEYPRSEVHEFYEAGLWFGPFGNFFNTSAVVMAPVFPRGSVPQIMNLYVADPNYLQLLVEFDDGLVITDAAPHRSKIVLQWIEENLPGKKVTHVVPSHHHRDHTGGIGDYLAAGAKLVIPEIAKDFYSKVNDGKFETITYTDKQPFVKEDKNVRFASFWRPDNSHARDWTYAVAAPACSRFNASEVVIFNADVINPSPGPDVSWDTAEALPFFIDAVSRGVPREATLIGTHGGTPYGLGTQDSLSHLADVAGFTYPRRSVKDIWCHRGTA